MRSRWSVARSSMYSRNSASLSVDERDRRVVAVIRVEAEHPLAEPMILSQRLGATLRRFDQVFDDRDRNVVAVKRRFEGRLVAARLREKQVALEHRVVERGVRVDARRI